MSVSTSIYQIHTLTVGYEYLESTSNATTGTGTATRTSTANQFSAAFSRDISQRNDRRHLRGLRVQDPRREGS
jgi:hypothetical protein